MRNFKDDPKKDKMTSSYEWRVLGDTYLGSFMVMDDTDSETKEMYFKALSGFLLL